MICGLGLMVLATSCDNFLDVHPKGEIVGKDLLSERKGFENALYGVYASMRNDKAYGAYMTYYVMDVLAQYFNCPGNSDITDLSAFKYKENPEVTKVFSDIWSTMYQNISYANNILVNLENQSPETLEFYDIYKGEALGLRAYMHFDLLRLYADQATDAKTRGIVYNTAFSLKPSDILPKTSALLQTCVRLRNCWTTKNFMRRLPRKTVSFWTSPSTLIFRQRVPRWPVYTSLRGISTVLSIMPIKSSVKAVWN